MPVSSPILLATWSFGRAAVAAGWPHLVRPGGGALDAVEHACRAVEADPACASVGRGGRPDAAGEVTLDAAVMLAPDRCGSVCFVRRVMHAVTLARLVMERTPHVMLAGDGAERFAREQGMAEADLLTDAMRARFQEWRASHRAAGDSPPAQDSPPPGPAHDTVGVLALDASGTLAGACSTSGLPFKRPGRVGDSPIIGHGLYVDPRAGAAVATGHGELIMGVCGTFLAVERMRQGAAPADAAADVIRRIIESFALRPDHQAAVIALAPDGRWSSAALRPGFQAAVKTPGTDGFANAEEVLLS